MSEMPGNQGSSPIVVPCRAATFAAASRVARSSRCPAASPPSDTGR